MYLILCFFYSLQVGRPIRNGTYAGKKMVSSVYAKAVPESECVQIDIFVNNAIEDQSQVSIAYQHTSMG